MHWAVAARERPCNGSEMRDVDLDLVSRAIDVVPYDARWPDEYRALEARLHAALGDAALRIDHIGSTAVPGLCAKDLIDIQITVASLDDGDALTTRLQAAGFRQTKASPFVYDLLASLDTPHSPELRKRYFREPLGEKRVHIHVREAGRLNQRYALLFRDYLRATPTARQAYGELKTRAAQIFPHNIDGYLFLKEPMMDLIYEAAQRWAKGAGWRA